MAVRWAVSGQRNPKIVQVEPAVLENEVLFFGGAKLKKNHTS